MLTLQFVPYHEVERLTPEDRLVRLLTIVKEGKIALLEGQLDPREEAALIRLTMECIDHRFRGIEISPLTMSRPEVELVPRLRARIVNLLLGNQHGLTIIGPATVVKEIRRDPDKLQLLTREQRLP